MKYKDEMVQAIIKEISLRQEELKTKHLTSIYFGGGTPSVLDGAEIDAIFEGLAHYFTWDEKTEITLEANPDDLSKEKLQMFSQSEVNRLSIGVQSFHEADLTYMNRAHTVNEAEVCIKTAQDLGMSNISADLIYGSPVTDHLVWESNVDKMIAFDIPHVSAYALTVEEGTALHHFVNTGKSQPIDDEKQAVQFDSLIAKLGTAGYDHYEISNFAKPGKYAVHNSNYWKGIPYLGLGPAAHSFDGLRTRSWNLAHNAQYIQHINEDHAPVEREQLTNAESYNEYILINLRTIWGIDLELLENRYPEFGGEFAQKVIPFIESKEVSCSNGKYTLTNKGKMMGDKISMELFVD